jgi:magnesium chelatase family protein
VRIEAARAAQAERLVATPWRLNGTVDGSHLRTALKLPAAVTRPLDVRFDTGEVTMRGYDRMLRLAWTLADLAGRDRPGVQDVDQAVMMRRQGRVAA